jgi:uncharacterized protein (UPF0261 family)
MGHSVNLTFDAHKINIEPCGGSRILIDVDTMFINEVLEDIDDQDIIDYAKTKVLATMSESDHLSHVTAEDAVKHFDVDDLLEYIGMDTIMKFIRNHE